MTKVLVIQGAGMNMRGKAQVEIFGPTTLDQMNEQILGFGEALGVDVEVFHSNSNGAGTVATSPPHATVDTINDRAASEMMRDFAAADTGMCRLHRSGSNGG